MRMIIQISLTLLFMSANVFAQQHDTEHSVTHSSHSSEHNTHYHKNHFSIFTGGTSEFRKDNSTHFTLGADYVRRFTETGFLGIGVFGEIIFADHKKYLLGVPLYLYLAHNLWVRAGPGLEIIEGYSSNSGSQSNRAGSSGGNVDTDTLFLLRAGIGYDHEMRGFTIGPAVSIDLIDGETLIVLGLNIGKGF